MCRSVALLKSSWCIWKGARGQRGPWLDLSYEGYIPIALAGTAFSDTGNDNN